MRIAVAAVFVLSLALLAGCARRETEEAVVPVPAGGVCAPIIREGLYQTAADAGAAAFAGAARAAKNP
jgi:uncharacterized lipoprotein YajG